MVECLCVLYTTLIIDLSVVVWYIFETIVFFHNTIIMISLFLIQWIFVNSCSNALVSSSIL